MTTLDIADFATHRDAQIEHDARVRNAAIAECQRFIRSHADDIDRQFDKANLPLIMVTAYRSAAAMLEGMKTP